MKIAFVTAHSPQTSTITGRIQPLAAELKAQAEVTIYCMAQSSAPASEPGLKFVYTGKEPFNRTQSGKQRLTGLSLVMRMLHNTWLTFRQLLADKPDIVIISKPLPQNTLACALARLFYTPRRIVLDCDDYELQANVLTSLMQRAAIHASERLACHISGVLVAATPFLHDHLAYLTSNKKTVHLIPTGHNLVIPSLPEGETQIVYAGSLSVSSGHRVDMLIDIMKAIVAAHPAVKLSVAGSGDDATMLKEMARQANLEHAIIWHGQFTASSLLALLNQHTILIDPVDSSIVARSKSSFRCMLALAAGLPVVTSNVGIRTSLIPRALQPRFFASPGDTGSYIQQIQNLLKQPLTSAEKNLLQNEAGKYLWSTLAASYRTILKP